jgi:predicted outer membrane lipoprotein
MAVCYSTFVQAAGNRWYYTSIAGILLIGAFGFVTNDRYEDTQLGAYRVMNVEMQAYTFLEKEQAYDKEIALACTWTAIRLNDTAQGFLSSKRIFTNLKRFPITPTTQYAIFGNSCEDKGDHLLMQKNPDFHLVYQVKDGDMWAAIYKRN